MRASHSHSMQIVLTCFLTVSFDIIPFRPYNDCLRTAFTRPFAHLRHTRVGRRRGRLIAYVHSMTATLTGAVPKEASERSLQHTVLLHGCATRGCSVGLSSNLADRGAHVKKNMFVCCSGVNALPIRRAAIRSLAPRLDSSELATRAARCQFGQKITF